MDAFAIRARIHLARDQEYMNICIDSDAKEVVMMCNYDVSERSINAPRLNLMPSFPESQ